MPTPPPRSQAVDGVPGCAQGANLPGQAAERRPVRRHAQELRPDMHGEAGRLQVRQIRCAGIGRQRTVDGDAELGPACGRSKSCRCVRASTSGLMRRETRAVTPASPATAEIRSSSASDSALSWRMPERSARAISSRVLPTPENTIRCAGIPAASARRNSPAETTSAPAPSFANAAMTAWFELAFKA